MSHYDQYNSQNANPRYPPQQYSDQAEAAYNPYDTTQPHQTYEQAGYGYPDNNYGGYRDEPAESSTPPQAKKEKGAYEAETYAASGRTLGPKSSLAMRRWRYEHQGNLWTRGSRVRTCGRAIFCLIFTFLFFFIGIILSLLLWVQPPNVEIGDVAPNSNNGSVFQLQQNPLGVTINLGVPVAVNNPNYFSVKFDSIDATIFYPINNTVIGGGSLKDLKIQDHKQTNFTLPFQLDYTQSIDPGFAILDDIANKCGFTGQARQNIQVNYELHLSFKILFIPIKPTIRNSASFSCPITADDISDLLKAAGIDIAGLSNLAKAFL